MVNDSHGMSISILDQTVEEQGSGSERTTDMIIQNRDRWSQVIDRVEAYQDNKNLPLLRKGCKYGVMSLHLRIFLLEPK
jgi:hypothetical protein